MLALKFSYVNTLKALHASLDAIQDFSYYAYYC